MNTQKEYEVLRLIEHNRICYVSSDIVKGCSLARWIEMKGYLPKDQFVKWMQEMTQQLVQIHKCRGNPCYQYVNPYSLIVSGDRKLCFLNMRADSNKKRVKIMLKSNIREYFLPGGCTYQDMDEELDIYGLGKTIQYMLAFAQIEPALTRREEREIRKIIEKCLVMDGRKRFKKISEVYIKVQELDRK